MTLPRDQRTELAVAQRDGFIPRKNRRFQPQITVRGWKASRLIRGSGVERGQWCQQPHRKQ